MEEIFIGITGDVGVISSVAGLGEGGATAVDKVGCNGVMARAPWLFSERDVRDLMRLKKPLFLDSRFLSADSGELADGPLPEGILEMIKMTEKGKMCQKSSNDKKVATDWCLYRVSPASCPMATGIGSSTLQP